ncbi:MAG: hypothetical protein AB7P03_08350 [Kofleriaceae bacterium]
MTRFVIVLAMLFAPAIAAAHPKLLPFSYGYQTAHEGEIELEHYTDFIPVRVARENPDGTLEGVWGARAVLQSEIEVGVTDKLELGWYFVFRQGATASTPALRFQGLKQRVRYRFAEAGEWPVDLGVYLEIAEFYDEVELEQKILLARQLGVINLVANLWVEQEYYFQTGDSKFIYNPTVGATYEITPRVTVGAEYWVRGRFDSAAGDTDVGDAPTAARHYLGPTVMAQTGKIWLALGAYGRLDRIAKAAIVDDPYGKLWIRAIVGIEL